MTRFVTIAVLFGALLWGSDRDFWAFQPVHEPQPPAVAGRTPIDRFILAKLQQKGLEPARAAGKRTLLRRLTLDVTGLPPTPEEIAAFVADPSPDAFATVVDRLLASPRYGERWGRHWLDVARYSDDRLDPERDNPYPNAFRYRDWVIAAFNRDLPYDRFVKAQLAGDQMEPPERAALGFQAMPAQYVDDIVDVTTRAFLGLTVGCAQCHDHKFDPIPAKDYYSLRGVFLSSVYEEFPLAPADVVMEYQSRKKEAGDQRRALEAFDRTEGYKLGETLAGKTAAYLLAESVEAPGLDPETAARWKNYLRSPKKEHPFLAPWFAARSPDEKRRAAYDFQRLVLSVLRDKLILDEKNRIKLGPNPDNKTLAGANLAALDRDRFFLWKDLFDNEGVFRYTGAGLERFLTPDKKSRFDEMRAKLRELEKTVPPPYPFLHAVHDVENPQDMRVQIRGNQNQPGEVAPRRFLSVLSRGEPAPFRKGSGRLELAEAIVDPSNPLTARVIVNRIWMLHFGQGLVRTANNFGELGDRPSHPELLDYLASRLVAGGWSMKVLHREILLTDAYARSSAYSETSHSADPENRLLWRFNRRRLDAGEIRDALLAAGGNLDLSMRGLAQPMTDSFERRSVYGFVSRRKLDGMLALFDFPNANATSEHRLETNVPAQQLYFMNGAFVMQEAGKLAARLSGSTDEAKIQHAYQLLYARDASPVEVALGLDYLRAVDHAWARYTQALLMANEFRWVN